MRNIPKKIIGGIFIMRIKGKAYWVYNRRPNEMSGKYQIDIANLDAKTVKSLKKMKLPLMNKDDERGDYITLKSSFPYKIVDAKKNELDEEFSVGNGSTVIAVFETYEYEPQNDNQTGVGAGPRIIQILELVEFEGSEKYLEELEEEEGFETMVDKALEELDTDSDFDGLDEDEASDGDVDVSDDEVEDDLDDEIDI